MDRAADSLAAVFDGWNGYQTSLVHAVEPLTAAQLAWRPSESHRSVGELVRHIAVGRLQWFMRMDAPESAELAAPIEKWFIDGDGNRYIVEEALSIADNAGELVRWLSATWGMVEATLQRWSVADLSRSYRHKFRGTTYDVSRQWTLFRILAHDLHHGGQLTILLGMQGIDAFELIGLGGHIVEPPHAEPL